MKATVGSLERMELLAPAGDQEAFFAALAGGADAIYLGGKAFSARQSAANFDNEQLQKATDLLHLHGKRIYVTVNTLIADREMESALAYLAELYNMGIDAVIIQDLGLIQAARQHLPNLELHASTQMIIHNKAGARYLRDLGFKRVVLARELTAAEVGAIAEDSGLELECFVHGALCVCYSGGCLMSSIIGGRSGNRGRCAQPCRLEYRLFRDKEEIATNGNYLLSTKDLALLPLIPELQHAGVSSLKIEGRMKHPDYVYAVTKTYRQALDAYYRDPEHFLVDSAWQETLEQIFNRGLSVGYFGGLRNKELMSFSRPNNRGIYAGRIKQVNSGKVTMQLETKLELGDELEVWVSKGGRATTRIEQLDTNGQSVSRALADTSVSFNLSGRVFPGDRVFKVYSAGLVNEAKQAVSDENLALKIPCAMEIWGRVGEPLKLTCSTAPEYSVTVASKIPLQLAKNRPLTAEVIGQQLGRLGNTSFYLDELSIDLSPDLMLPLSALNQLRRDALAELTELVLKPYRCNPVGRPQLPAVGSVIKSKGAFPSLSVWVADLEGVRQGASSGAAIIYAGGDELTNFHWDLAQIRTAADLAHAAGSKLVVGLPRINRDPHWKALQNFAAWAGEAGADGIIVSDLGGLEWVLKNTTQTIYLNYTLNLFNSFSLKLLPQERIAQVTLSPELTLAQIMELTLQSKLPLEVLVQGPLELMVSEYCPINSTLGETGKCKGECRHNSWYLRDRMQIDFPIFTDQFCHLHLLNSKDLCLYGDLDRICKASLATVRLELKTAAPSVVSTITKAYAYALKKLENGAPILDADQIMEQFKHLTGQGITKGHFFRGIL